MEEQERYARLLMRDGGFSEAPIISKLSRSLINANAFGGKAVLVVVEGLVSGKKHEQKYVSKEFHPQNVSRKYERDALREAELFRAFESSNIFPRPVDNWTDPDGKFCLVTGYVPNLNLAALYPGISPAAQNCIRDALDKTGPMGLGYQEERVIEELLNHEQATIADGRLTFTDSALEAARYHATKSLEGKLLIDPKRRYEASLASLNVAFEISRRGAEIAKNDPAIVELSSSERIRAELFQSIDMLAQAVDLDVSVMSDLCNLYDSSLGNYVSSIPVSFVHGDRFPFNRGLKDDGQIVYFDLGDAKLGNPYLDDAGDFRYQRAIAGISPDEESELFDLSFNNYDFVGNRDATRLSHQVHRTVTMVGRLYRVINSDLVKANLSERIDGLKFSMGRYVSSLEEDLDLLGRTLWDGGASEKDCARRFVDGMVGRVLAPLRDASWTPAKPFQSKSYS